MIKKHVTYQIRNSFFVVTIDNANYIPSEILNLTDRQKVLWIFKNQNSTITNLSNVFSMDRKTIRKDLEILESLNLIESVGTTNNKIWMIKNK